MYAWVTSVAQAGFVRLWEEFSMLLVGFRSCHALLFVANAC